MFKVLSLPGRGGPNPYVDLFYDALLPHGIELVGKLTFNYEWLKSNSSTFDAIHLHWPELLWRNYRPASLRRLRTSTVPGSWRTANYLESRLSRYFNKKKIDWFAENVLFLKGQGKKILYTWHNLEPHENVSRIDFLGNEILSEYADLIIFHSEWAETQCRQQYNIRAKTVVMPHGNYDGIYPAARNRDLVARELGLDPGKPIVGCLGAIRDYKGIDIACEALILLKGSSQFLCAGKPRETFALDTLKNDISKIKGAVLVPKMISDQEFSDFANLCDCLLLPYKQVTGSGALLAALTLSRGVIASDFPYFREVLKGVPNSGLLVEPNHPESLAAAIMTYLAVPSDVRNTAARSLADKYKWALVVKPVVEILHPLIHP